MPFIKYVPIERALPMVEAVNNAKTEREHRDARYRKQGYKQAYEEMGYMWPVIELDLHFMEHTDRPMCGGEYLDWAEKQEEQQ